MSSNIYQPVSGGIVGGAVGLLESQKNQLESVLGGNSFSGGSSVMGGSSGLGGYESLKDYANSVYSKSKEDLIRAIAGDIFSALKMKPKISVKSDPVEKIVQVLISSLPGSKKGKKFNASFNSSSSKQKDVCDAFVTAINANYKTNLIPTDLSEHAKCEKVYEVMNTLLVGLNTEFMTVASDLMTMLKNMQTINEFIDASYRRQAEIVNASGDEQLRSQSDNAEQLYKMMKAELDRQMAMISNLVNVTIQPIGKNIISLLEENKDFAGLVKDIKNELGTSAFGDKISFMLSGVSNVAHTASLIEKAMKKLGMSLSEFKSSKNATELRAKIYDNILKKSPSSKQLEEMLNAADIIYKNNYSMPEVLKYLNNKSGGNNISGGMTDGYNNDSTADGGCDCTGSGAFEDTENDKNLDSVLGGMYGGGTDEDEYDLNVSGGAEYGADGELDDEYSSYWSKKSLGKKIKKKSKHRELLLNDFKRMLKKQKNTVVKATYQIMKLIEDDAIKPSDDLDEFIKAFQSLPDLNQDNIHIALSGYARDAASRQKREEFLNNYKLVATTLEPLCKGVGSQYFKNIQNATLDMVKLLDNFSDKILNALTQIHVDTPEEIHKSLSNIARKFGSFECGDCRSSGQQYGGGYDGGNDVSGGNNMEYVSFNRVKEELSYHVKVNNIRKNLNKVSADIESFGDEYEQVLGEEAAWLIDQNKRYFHTLIEQTNPEKDCTVPYLVDQGCNKNTLAKLIHTALSAVYNTDKDRAMGTYKNLIALWTMQLNAKIGLIQVSQAIDVYLRSFANGIAKNPDAIEGVVKMLGSVEIVAKWFSERSGDNLAAIFEAFPSGYNALVPEFSGGASSATVDDNDNNKVNMPIDSAEKSYYVWLEGKFQAGAAGGGKPGNPYLGLPMDWCDKNSNKSVSIMKKLKALTDKTVKSMRALENILSAFSTIGSRFGNLDLNSKTFMKPGQMFNLLCDYVVASTFTSCFAPSIEQALCGVYVGGVPHNGIDTGGGATSTIPSTSSGRYRIQSNGDVVRTTDSIARKILNMTGIEFSDVYGILSGVSNATGAANPAPNANLRKYSAIAMSAIPYDSGVPADGMSFWKYHDAAATGIRVDTAGWLDHFHDTDLLFIMTIKSMVAKIFTTVDAFKLLHCPSVNRVNDSLKPLRMILGGGGKDASYLQFNKPVVKIIPEATEAYFRLILLAEYYRDVFGFKEKRDDSGVNGTENSPWKLSMVPSISGVWSELINVIFDQAEGVKEGNYTESQVSKIIETINDVYRRYTSSEKSTPIRSMINAFIIEMNRVMGFIKQEEIDSYLKERRAYLNGIGENSDDAEADFVDYDILDSTGQFGQGSAPSDKFVTVGDRVRKRKSRSMVHLQQEIHRIREKMDSKFLSYTQNTKGEYSVSFIETLKNYKAEVKRATTDVDRYNIILRMIQGTNKLINVAPDKLIMLHEAVAFPLYAVYSTYKVLAKYNAIMHGLSLRNLREFADARSKYDNTLVADDTNGLRTAYERFLNDKYPHAECKIVKDTILNMLFGEFEVMRDAGYAPSRLVVGGQLFYFPLIGQGAALPFTGAGRVFDPQNIAKVYLNAILDIGSGPNKLVECTANNSGSININTTPVENLCKNLLASVRDNLNKLRIHFDGNALQRYEDRSYVGSVNWLDENLVKILLDDRDKCGLATANADLLKLSLQEMSDYGKYGSMCQAVNEILFYKISAGNLCLTEDGEIKRRNQLPYNSVNNLTTFPFNILPVIRGKEERHDDEQKAVVNSASGNVLANANEIRAANKIFLAPVINFLEAKDADVNKWSLDVEQKKSLIFAFNEVLRQYLLTNVDNDLKLYAPLIDGFVTEGTQEIVNGRAYPDISQRVSGDMDNQNILDNLFTNVNIANAPPDDTVIFASNAQTALALLSVVDMRLKVPRHRITNISEVKEYMKERMKCNLPHFSHILSILIDKVVLLKQILNYTCFSKNITSRNLPVGVMVHANRILPKIELNLKDLTLKPSSEDMLVYYDGLLNRLEKCCRSLKSCADKVYTDDLGDKWPYFAEINADFIAKYKRDISNGVLPFMPASISLLAICGGNGVHYNRILEANSGTQTRLNPNSHLMLPNSMEGTPAFKFNYASRYVLTKNFELKMEHVPGAGEIYNLYASLSKNSGNGNLITPTAYSNTILGAVRLIKYLGDGSIISRIASVHGGFTMNQIVECGALTSASPFSDLRDVHYQAKKVWSELVDAVDGAAAATTQTLRCHAANQLMKHNILPVGFFDGQPLDGENKDPNAILVSLAHAKGVATTYLKKYLKSNPLGLIKASVGTFQSMNDAEATIDIIENVNMIASKEKIALACVVGGGVKRTGDDRERMQIYNILDMNVVPLNVASFMREVPFCNLINYSYTLDRMMHDMILPSHIAGLLKKDGCDNNSIDPDLLLIKPYQRVSTTRELLVKLITYPYANLNFNYSGRNNLMGLTGVQYYALLASLFTGNDTLQIGRPRYLSDQILHKVLLTSSIQLVPGNARNELNMADENNHPQFIRLEGGPSAYDLERHVIHYAWPSSISNQSLDSPMGSVITGLNSFVNISANIILAGHANPVINLLAAAFGDDGGRPNAMPAVMPAVNTSLTISTAITNIYKASTNTNYDTHVDLLGNINVAALTNLAAGVNVFNIIARNNNANLGKVTTTAYTAAVKYVANCELEYRTNYDLFVHHHANMGGIGHVLKRLSTSRHLDVDIDGPIAAGSSANIILANYFGVDFNDPVVATRGNCIMTPNLSAIFNLSEGKIGKGMRDAIIIKLPFLSGGIFNPNIHVEGKGVSKNNIPAGLLERLGENEAAQLILIGEILSQRDLGFSANNLRSVLYLVCGSLLNAGVCNGNPEMKEFKSNYVIPALYSKKDREILNLSTYEVVFLYRLLSKANTLDNLMIEICHHNGGVLHFLFKVCDEVMEANYRTQGVGAPEYLKVAGDPVSTNGLKYFSQTEKRWKTVNNAISTPDVIYCAELGKLRFDTKLVRNLTWFVQLQRMLRYVLVKHFAEIQSPVIRGLQITKPNYTEYRDEDTFAPRETDGLSDTW